MAVVQSAEAEQVATMATEAEQVATKVKEAAAVVSEAVAPLEEEEEDERCSTQRSRSDQESGRRKKH